MWKRVLKDKNGSSLVLVMLCMSFLILLAGAVITTTITNIYLKKSQKYTQENFYETDSILDAIAAGIQNESSEASAKAYEQALGEYNVSLTSAGDSMNDKYAQDFLDRMIKQLQGTTTGYVANKTDYYYLDSVLKSYLKSSDEANYVEKTAHDGADGVEGHGRMVLDGDALVLKGVKVIKAHNTQTDYETTLETDIRIEVPSVSTEAHSEYLGYAILADDQVQVNAGSGITAEVNGNVYAGTVNRAKSVDDTKEAGILVSGATLKINAEQIITRGDVYVSDVGTLNIGKSSSSEKNAELWVENIITKGTVGNHLTINASAFVADDTEIGGDNDQVTFSGKYYGYNFTDDYSAVASEAPASGSGTGFTPVKLSKTASYSSSISLNGYDEQLRMDNLKELVLAGRTFISKKTNKDELDSANNALVNPDIELGESLAVKSGQLTYLVAAMKSDTTASLTNGFVKQVDQLPADTSDLNIPAGGVGFGSFHRDDKDGVVKCYFFNTKIDGAEKCFLFDYQAYENYLDVKKNTDGSKKLDLEEYLTSKKLDNVTPLMLYTRNDKSIYGGIYYFYLNFADSKTASKFFDLYYNNSSRQTIYDAVNKSYVDAVGIKLPSAGTRDYILSAGNIMYNTDESDGQGKTKMKLKLENSSQNPSASFIKFAKDNSKIYMSKQLALVDDYEEAKNSSQWRLYDDSDPAKPAGTKLTKSGWKADKNERTNLFDRLVDRDKISEAKGSYPIVRDNGQTGNCYYIISNNDVTWDSSTFPSYDAAKDGIFILTTKTVTVKGGTDFHGLIIAGDDVNLRTVAGNKVISDAEAIEKLFEKDKADASPKFYNAMSKYFRKSVDAMIGNDGTSADTNNVTYENWKKND